MMLNVLLCYVYLELQSVGTMARYRSHCGPTGLQELQSKKLDVFVAVNADTVVFCVIAPLN